MGLGETAGLAEAGRTALGAGISRGVAEETATPLEAVLEAPGDTTDQAHALVVVVVPPAWALAEEEASEVEADVAAVDGVDK